MKMIRRHLTFLPLFILLLQAASCKDTNNKPVKSSWENIKKAWSGAAEISTYELTQERYGQLRKGESVMIYVREPFLKDRQVKDESGKGSFQVLKLNSTRKFHTGVYPYYTLVSVFQPLEKQSVGTALKVTTSVQEWCGHVFMQTNRRNGELRTEVKSYFEKEEGGIFKEKSSVYLEDEIWTSLRLDPTALPTGNVQMIQGSLASRFSHQNPTAEPASTKWLPGNSKQTLIYQITYPKSGRKLAIEVQKQLPYAILGWNESINTKLLSSGKLKKRESNIDYWNYNQETKGKKLKKKLQINP